MPAWVLQVGKRALPYDLERAPQGVGESVEAAPPVAAAVVKPPQPLPDGPKPPRPDGPQTPGLHRRCVHRQRRPLRHRRHARFRHGRLCAASVTCTVPIVCTRAVAEARMMHLTHIRANACTQCVMGLPPRHHAVSQRTSQLSLSRQLGHTAHGVLWRAHGMAARLPTLACCAPYFAVCRRPRCDRWRVRAGKRPSTRRNVACPSRRATRRRGVGP